MSSRHEEDPDRFRALLSIWKGAYVCGVRSYVGIRSAEASHLLYGRVLSETSRSGIDETRFKFETEHVFAGRLVTTVGPHDVDAIIAKASMGETDGLDNTLFYHPFISEGSRLPSLLIRDDAKHALLTTAGEARSSTGS